MTFGPGDTSGYYLINNQRFSKDWDTFLTQITKLYSDIARQINVREVSAFDLTEIVNGEQWFNPANVQIKRGGFRQVFQFTSNGSFAHNITNLTLVTAYGQFTDGTNFYGAIYASSVAIAGQVTFYVTPTNIVVLSGAAAPVIISGVIVLDYLKN